MKHLLFIGTLFWGSTFLISQSIQWQSLNEPGNGGRTTDVAIDPNNADHILIAGDMLGLGYSNDGGQTWLPTFGFNSYELGAITFHPTNSDLVWVGSMSGPFLSMDGGLTWTLKRKGMPAIRDFFYTSPIELVLFDPQNDQRLLAFGGSKRDWNNRSQPKWNVVWESLDGGDNWRELSTVGTPARPGISAAAFAGPNKLFAAVRDQGLWVSHDNGLTWELTITGLPERPDVYHVAVDPTNSEIVYLSLNNYLVGEAYQPGGIYQSTNGGESWVKKSTGLQQTAHSNPFSASYYQTVKVAPSNSDVLYTANSGWFNAGVYISQNQGETWNAILNKTSTGNFPLTFFDAAGPGLAVFDIAANDANVFVGGGSSKVLLTKDAGVTWDDLMSEPTSQPGYFTGNGFCGLVSRNVAFNPFDPTYCVLQAMDNGKFMHSNDNLKSWKRAGAGMSEYLGGNDVTFATADIIYCTTGQANFDGVWKSVDQGNSWIKFEIDAFPNANASARPLGIHTLSGGPDFVWVVLDEKSYHTNNGGNTWQMVLSAPGLNYMAGQSDAPVLYLNSDHGVYQTTNGTDFSLMTNSPRSGERIILDPNNNNTIYLTKWRTNDGEEGLWRFDGVNWVHIREDYYALGIAIQPGNSDVLLLGTNNPPFHDIMYSSGVWLSIDGGQNWSQQNDGLPMVRSEVVAFNPHRPNEVITGTQGRGYFIGNLELSTSTEEDIVSFIPNFEIGPNPTSDVLNIHNLTFQSMLLLYNAKGQFILSMAPRGEVTTMDLKPYPPGIYFIEIQDLDSGRNWREKIIKK